jgi:hypothetical protein
MTETKRDIAAKLVMAEARYMPDSPLLSYHIRLAGKFFASDCTSKLADKVAEAFTKQELVDLLGVGS